MSNSPAYGTIDSELRSAVSGNDVQKVTHLLSQGNKVYLRDILHSSPSAEMVKVLLFHGARVNALNEYGENALFTAVNTGRYEVVQELLKHGAFVNLTSRRNNSALHCAVKPRDFLYDRRIIVELLNYGAFINVVNSPLDCAICLSDDFELPIKYTLLRDFERNYHKMINLRQYQDKWNYAECIQYFESCVKELEKMNKEVAGKLSLFKLVKTDEKCLFPLYPSNELANKDFSTSYPIYHDVIAKKIALCLKRGELLNKLRETDVYTRCPSIEGVEVKKHLNSDVMIYIAKYLSSDEMSHLITAFQNPSLGVKNNFIDNDKASESSIKRAKLDISL